MFPLPLTWNFWMISWVDLCIHSSTLISGCCSRSEALGVLVCLFTLECLGNSSSSKLLNSGILWTDKQVTVHCMMVDTNSVLMLKNDTFVATNEMRGGFGWWCHDIQWEVTAITNTTTSSCMGPSIKVAMVTAADWIVSNPLKNYYFQTCLVQ